MGNHCVKDVKLSYVQAIVMASFWVKYYVDKLVAQISGRGLLRREYSLHISTWNIRNLKIGKFETLKREMAKLNLDVVGIGEVKWQEERFLISRTQCDKYGGLPLGLQE